MANRHLSRSIVLQTLFEWDFEKELKNISKHHCNFEEAMEDYNKAIEINPEYIDAYNSLGVVNYKNKNYDQK